MQSIKPYGNGVLFLCHNSGYCNNEIEFGSYYVRCRGYPEYNKRDLIEISFDCSFPELNLNQYFQDYINLRTLDLSNVDLKILKKDDFEEFPNITRIDLSYNKLTKIPANIFTKNVNLLSANFSFNEISAIDPLVFAGATKLENVDLSKNFLKTLDSSVFAELRWLQILDLSRYSIW